MYALLLPTLAVAGVWLLSAVRIWRRGQAERRWDRPLARISAGGEICGCCNCEAWRKLYPGTMHAMIFWGFIVLTIATTVVMLDYDFGIPIMRGYFYLVFQSFITDVFGALAIVGIGMAAVRRWIVRPRELVYSREASAILVVIFVILVSGFLVEGWRIAATDDPWARWSPFGNLVARASAGLISIDTMRTAHAATWWPHLALVFGFLAWAPYTKMAHVLTSTLNIYTARLAPIGAMLRKVDFDSEEKLGIHSLAGFTLEGPAGFRRLYRVWPLHGCLPGQPRGQGAVAARHYSRPAAAVTRRRCRLLANVYWRDTGFDSRRHVGVYDLRSMRRACPVSIEQMPKIIDTRRYLVMEDAEFPDTMQQALRRLSRAGIRFAARPFPASIGRRACPSRPWPKPATLKCCFGWVAAGRWSSEIKRSCGRWRSC